MTVGEKCAHIAVMLSELYRISDNGYAYFDIVLAITDCGYVNFQCMNGGNVIEIWGSSFQSSIEFAQGMDVIYERQARRMAEHIDTQIYASKVKP